MTAEFFANAASLLITIMIFSYLVGDNPVFRIAVNVLVGVAAGYVAAVAWWQVLLPRLIVPLLAGPGQTRAMLAVPFLLSGLLLMKAWPALSRLGAPALGLLVGVASAVAIAGAIQGTLSPQLTATINSLGADQTGNSEALIDGGFVLFGLIASLVYFQFSAGIKKDGVVRRPLAVEWLATVGGVLIAVALGVLFAGVYAAALTALVERLHFVLALLGLG